MQSFLFSYNLVQLMNRINSLNFNIPRENMQEGRPMIGMPGERKKFVKNVYTILLAQLLVTSIFVYMSVFWKPFLLFQLENFFLFDICAFIIVSVGCLFCLFPHYGKEKPRNYLLLAAFTLAESWLISCFCGFFPPSVVLQAATTTAAATIGITIYAWKTRNDFTENIHYVHGFIWCSGSTFIWTGFYSFVLMPGIFSYYSILMVISICIYLLYDTQLILGGKSFKLDMDNYIFGAFILYIDIIAIFVRLVRYYQRNRRRRN